MAEGNESDWLRSVTNRTTKAVTITSSSLVLFLSLVGNFLVVAVFYRNKTLRSPVHYFIANMAVSDLVIPVVVMPLEIARQYNGGLWMFDGVIGSLLCKLQKMAWGISITVTIFSKVSIAFDRFHGILFAMKLPLISRKTCLLIIVIMWITSIVFRAHIIYGYRVVHKATGMYCEFQWEPVSYTKKAKRINDVLYLIFSAISAVVLTVLYSSIIIFLYRQKSSIHMASETVKCRAKENRKVTCMLVMVVIVFYAVWIPHHVLVFLFYFRSSLKLQSLISWIAYGLPILYAVINPVVYFLFNEKYRRGFRELLCCLLPCNTKCCHSSTVPLGVNAIQNDEQVVFSCENFALQERR